MKSWEYKIKLAEECIFPFAIAITIQAFAASANLAMACYDANTTTTYGLTVKLSWKMV